VLSEGPQSRCGEEAEESNCNPLDKGCPQTVPSEGARGERRMGGASPFWATRPSEKGRGIPPDDDFS